MRHTTGSFRGVLPSSIMEALVCPSPLCLCTTLDRHSQFGHLCKVTALQEDYQCSIYAAACPSPAFWIGYVRQRMHQWRLYEVP